MTVTGNHCYPQRARRSWEKLIHQVPKRFIRRSYLLALAGFGALVVGGPAVWASPALTTLATFSKPNGVYPDGSLIADAAGNLYGTTSNGGAKGYGTVFEVAAGTHAFSTLATFNNVNGSYPSAGLTADAVGNLYGTTVGGGASGYGTVFQVAAGTHTLSTLATFGNSTGAYPQAGLFADSAGNLYGTTSGASNAGTVFEIPATTHALLTLATFNDSNGAQPHAGLIADAAGNLYGTTLNGGTNGVGTVFQIATGTHALSTLATFDGGNGSHPKAGLIADAAGNLYGTTYYGGAQGYGTVFQIDAGTHVLSTLATFNNSNGARPQADLIADAAGNLFGTTSANDGANGQGTVFEVAAGTHALSTLVTFNGSNGADPQAGLIADAAGNLYGTTSYGAVDNYGTVFEITQSGFVAATPEPAAVSLIGLAGLGLLARRRRSL